VGLVLWDIDGRIHDANDRFLDMLGRGRDELRSGRLDWSVVSPDDPFATRTAALASLKACGIARDEEMECVRRDGTRIFARLHSTVLPQAADMVISIVVDASEQRRASAEQ